MTAEPVPRLMSRRDYLALEERSPEQYEYLRGHVYPRHHGHGPHSAMAGARRWHVRLVTRLGGLLDAHLGAGPCEVYTNDMRLRVEEADGDFYPDLFVACGIDARTNLLELPDARLIVETLSPSTEGYDMGDKFEAYKLLPSLAEYVLLDTRRTAATVYRRTEGGEWLVQSVGPDDALELHSLGFRIAMTRLYAGIHPAKVAER